MRTAKDAATVLAAWESVAGQGLRRATLSCLLKEGSSVNWSTAGMSFRGSDSVAAENLAAPNGCRRQLGLHR